MRYGYMGDVMTGAPKKAGISSLRRTGQNQGYQAPPLPGDLPAANPESKTMLYVGLGIGALVLVGGAFLLLKN